MTDSDSSTANPALAENQALPLEELELTPQWVKTAGKNYASHSGAEPQQRREGRRPDRDRPRDEHREQGRRPRRPAGAGDDRRERRPEQRFSGPPRRSGPERLPTPRAPLTAPVDIVFQPEEKGFAAMIETMKRAPRAYAFFDVAKLVLNKPERHYVKFTHKPAVDPAAAGRPPLYLVLPSENVFLRQDEAVRFALRHHAEMIFREKKTPVDPPKGNFTFVNRCGITGVWLGPPNYHEYQGRLIRHHQQRLRQMPFEEFRSRIQTVRDPEAIKAWVDSMSSKMEYECILDAEPKSFATRDELEKHFVENHLAQFVTSVPEARISGTASRQLQNPALLETLRLRWLEERKFPMNTANEIRGKLRHEGFHFFKDPKGITFISPTKLQRVESITHLSEQIQKIILFLRQHFGCKRKQLLAHFVTPPETVVAPPNVNSTPAAAADVGTLSPPAVTPPSVSPTPEPAAIAEPVRSAAAAPVTSTEEERVLADLHWLIQDGYVVEFSDGRLWALPDKPPQPVPAAKPVPTAEPPPTVVAPAENASAPPTAIAPATIEPAPVPPPPAPPLEPAPPAPAADNPTPNPTDSVS